MNSVSAYYQYQGRVKRVNLSRCGRIEYMNLPVRGGGKSIVLVRGLIIVTNESRTERTER